MSQKKSITQSIAQIEQDLIDAKNAGDTKRAKILEAVLKALKNKKVRKLKI